MEHPRPMNTHPKSGSPKPSKSAKSAKSAKPSKSAKAGASHDTANPKALLDFMVTRWARTTLDVTPIDRLDAFRRRRAALSKRFPGETLLIPTGAEKVRANDTHYLFRPGTDFYYLTGHTEPDCLLAFFPKKTGHADTLFVEEAHGKKDATFFTDRAKGELWVGKRMGPEECKARYGLGDAKPLAGLPDVLKGLKSGKKVRVLRGVDPRVDAAVKSDKARDKELAEFLSELRLTKDDQELGELSKSIDSTKRGFEDVIATLKDATSEREVEGVFNLRARVEGNDVGYNTIAAAGAHACVLHWNHNHGPVRKGDLLLLDAGVEGQTLYTADITRTLPVAGKFTREQREIYELVHAAQAAAFRAVKPGNDFMEPNRAAMQVLARGLARIGILDDAETALKEENQFYKRYTLHNVSHMLGLDVHDCAAARQEAYKLGKLRPGMVLTVEPGLYFQLDDETVPLRYRGIGVRIEDDVVVTEDGCRNLSAHIPSASVEVEAWMSDVWRKHRRRALATGGTGP